MADVNDNPFLDDSNPFMDYHIKKHKQSKFNEIRDALHDGSEDDFISNGPDVSYSNIHQEDYRSTIIRKKKKHFITLAMTLVITVVAGLGISYGALVLQQRSRMYNIQAPDSSSTMSGNFRGNKCNIDGNSCSSDNNGNTIN